MYLIRKTIALGMVLLAVSVLPIFAENGYRVIQSNGEPLRGAFNADVGKIRVVILVAPT